MTARRSPAREPAFARVSATVTTKTRALLDDAARLTGDSVSLILERALVAYLAGAGGK
jgi:uncharacterized protein (DUF1778 family)